MIGGKLCAASPATILLGELGLLVVVVVVVSGPEEA